MGAGREELTLVDPLVGKEKTGIFLAKNFSSLKTLVFDCFGSVRPLIGDSVHLAFLNAVLESIQMLSPPSIRNIYRMGKLIGYFTAQQALSCNLLHFTLLHMRRSGLTWKILVDRGVQTLLKEGWKRSGGGILGVEEVDPENEKVFLSLEESVFSIVSGAEHPQCDFECGLLCGQLEYFLGGRWEGRETECAACGGKRCLFELSQKEEDGEGELPRITSGEHEKNLEQFLEAVLYHPGAMRPNVTDFGHISLLQTLNYVLINMSKGHHVLITQAGKVMGRKIAEKQGLKSRDEVFDCLKALFTEMRLGILEIVPGEDIMMYLNESALSYGVKDIGLKLCVYFAGLIEGCLDYASDADWVVEETECVASGSERCVFVCRKNTADVVRL